MPCLQSLFQLPKRVGCREITEITPSLSETSYVGAPSPTDHPARRPNLALGVLAVVFGWLAYFLYVRTALYWVGFLANWRVSRSVDNGPAASFGQALVINLALVLAFALPHSLLARKRFKNWLSQWLPAAFERSLYVLVASATLALLIWQWRPLPAVVWEVEAAGATRLLWGIFGLGWVLAVFASKSLGHARLFGLAGCWRWAKGEEPAPLALKTNGLYGRLRHPMYLGFAIGVWVTPHMSMGHLLMAVVMSAYLVVGARFEERDLERRFGEEYRAYRRRVPAIGLF